MKQSEQKMAEWLAHPLEFGERPEEVEEIHRESTPWPLFDEEVDLAFHRYRMKDGFTSIGMTGPITWSFLGDNLSGFTMEELKRLYAGWYISFAALNSPDYSREQNKRERKALEEKLRQEEEGFVEILDYLRINDLVFYTYRIRRDDVDLFIATDTTHKTEYEAGSKYLRLPPHYHFLGSLFFEGKL